MFEFSWGIFVALVAGAILIALGIPFGPIVLLAGIGGLLCAFRYPYLSFYVAAFCMPFLGVTVSIPTGEFAFGKRAFGGSIDIGIGEVLLLLVLVGWAAKILFLWVRRRDPDWRPSLPLAKSYALIFFAHIVSAFSPLVPDRVLALKFALRPVLFCYLAFIALPVNFIRSRQRLFSILGVWSAVGMIGAVNGAISLFFVDATSQFIRRAHPLPMFGVPALGDNHNLLAELMTVTVPMTLALATAVARPETKRLLYGAGLFQLLIGLLTFSRTGWIVFALQAAFLVAVRYRHVVRQHAAKIVAGVLCLLPLALVMFSISASNVAQSSNSTRLALLEIALDVFWTSPWIGGGAGTFVERVGSSHIFRVEYGEPLDSHGFGPKLAAETGLSGLVAFCIFLLEFIFVARKRFVEIKDPVASQAIVLLLAAAGGSVVYQLFNTNYWTGKMWMPIGIALAAFNAFADYEARQRRLEEARV